MKKLSIWIVLFLFISCQWNTQPSITTAEATVFPSFTYEDATQLANLPLECITQEFPNKLGQVLGSEADLATPKELRPAFYGCFDWHSAVHGHWSLVLLLKYYPDLNQADEIKSLLKAHLSKEHIQEEMAFFNTKENENFERTYGWAWLFQLINELHSWDDAIADELLENCMPLAEILEQKMIDFLPKLQYPIRAGEHPNTAFALSLTYDYAETFEKEELKNSIKNRAIDFYIQDKDCPLEWEPSGYDFLSPCLEEARLMAKILSDEEFADWLKTFLPSLYDAEFQLEIGKVGDRKDGKLVHLDGLNFSRAWSFFELAKQTDLAHLDEIGNQHFIAAYPNLIGDSYEGAHWLGSFALYAIKQKKND